MTNMTNLRTASGVAIALPLAFLLAGCATGNGPGSVQSVVSTPAVQTFNGVLYGGQSPISGATIQMYAVGTTGLQSAATPLVSTTVKTNQNGNFSLGGLWDCTSNTATYGVNPEIYIVATNGNPGMAAGTNNTSISSMAAIGPCNSFTSTSYVAINELTTVAAVYALAPFMKDYADIGAQGAGNAGLANAFNVANALVTYANGKVPGPNLPANATVPTATIYELADAIASCINTDGTGQPCAQLFANTTPANGTKPAETIGALLSLAKNPGLNVQTIFNNIPGASPYETPQMTQPNDWTIAINITGGGLSSPNGIAIDAGGNAWVANAGGNSVTELSGTGVPLTGTTGYTGSSNLYGAQGIAIDKTGNVWVANPLQSQVVEIAVAGGAIQSNATFTAGGISGPTGIAIDSGNNVWVANFASGSVTELNNSGAALGSSPLTANGTLQTPLGIAVDKSGNVWTTDNNASDIAEFANNQNLLSGMGYSDSATLAPAGIALDAAGRAWVTQNGTNAVSIFAPGGAALLTNPYQGGGLNTPAGIAIDGANTAWVANDIQAGSITQIAYGSSAPSSLATGFGVLNQPSGIAVDASGGVWTTNAGDNSVSLFVGLAAPVVTPIVAAGVGP